MSSPSAEVEPVRGQIDAERRRAATTLLLQRTFETIDALTTLDRPADILAVAADQFRRFGFTAFVLSRLPRATANIAPHILLNAWPSAWTDRYLEAGHYTHDPLRRHCLSTERVFSWSEIPEKYLDTPGAAAVLGEARDFRLKDGLCVPLHTSFGAGGLSLAGVRIEDEPGMRAMVRVLAFYVCDAVERTALDTATTKLTPRERDALTWVALGKTAPEIARKFGVSKHTITTHLKNARLKLGTANNAHSVAVALRSRQISI